MSLITKDHLSLTLKALKKSLEQIENARPAETTPEDIIEWMGQESVITPLASPSGQVYLTNDNKILII